MSMIVVRSTQHQLRNFAQRPDCLKTYLNLTFPALLLNLFKMASKQVSSCQLQCLQKSHEAVPLPDGVPVVIGRTPETKITDPRCSRKQLELTADWGHQNVRVRQLGVNASAVDGTDIGQYREVTASMNSTLFILSGQYPHRILFQSNQAGDSSKVLNGEAESSRTTKRSQNKEKKVDSVKSKASTKRQSSDTHDNDLKIKKQKIDKTHSKKTKEDNGGDDDGESDEDEHQLAEVAAKLIEMKNIAKSEVKTSSSKPDKTRHSTSSKPSAKDLPSGSTSSSSSSSSSIKKLSSSSAVPAESASWDTHEHLYVYTSKGVKPRNKIAGFDIDGTIIVTSSGKTFPTDANDWKINMPEIFKKLKELHAEKFKIVFFTNQLGVARGKTKIEELKTKVENIIAKLQVPVQVFIATHEGKYRKPMDGMWRKLKREYNGDLEINLKSSIYVGDAAGRLANWAPKKKKDFSCSDRLFALNIGVPFKTPEEFFQNQKATSSIKMPDFDPRKLRSDAELLSEGSKLTSGSKEIILLVGFPASGKSYFAANIMKPKGYEVVNRDTLGSWQKCVKRAQEALVNSSVVVDNTNLSKEERTRYVQLASKVKVSCRCFVFTTTLEHCRHNERFRQMTDKSHAKINEIIFNQAKSKFEEPSMSEGFTEIVNVNFVPKFTSPSMEADYRKFLLEK